ncbi:MAG: cytochrome c1 [Gammaproteobacteria bacterium]
MVLAPAPPAVAVGAIALLDADTDLGDRASLQRGARAFMNYCQGCHSLEFMRYKRMGDDLGITEEQVEENLLFAADRVVDEMTIAMRLADAEQWFGVSPPDLSVTARSRGPDWIYSYLLTFYQDDNPARPFGVNNVVFDGAAMPHALWSLQGHQRYVAAEMPANVASVQPTKLKISADELQVHKEVVTKEGDHVEVVDRLQIVAPGKLLPGQYRRTVRDLVNFLTYVAEPAKLVRYKLGLWVVLFLIGFFFLSRALYKEYWKDVAH